MIKMRAEKLSREYVNPNDQHIAIQELILNMGADFHTNKIKKTGPIGLKPRKFIINVAYQTLKKYHQSITFSKVSTVFDLIDEVSKSRLDSLVNPLPGVESLLLLLKKNNIKATIATTDLTSRAKLAMESINLIQYFDYIAGSEVVENSKPSPDLANYLCDKTSIRKERALIIGDSIADLEMAKNAHIDFIGVKTGLDSLNFLSNCEILVEDLTYVKGFLWE
jgi:phosphoglycolate phosphatase